MRLKFIYIVCLLFCFSNRMYANTIIWKVNPNGKAKFTSIQEAINAIPKDEHAFINIQIAAGIYNEKIFIKKSNFSLEGAGINETFITQSIARDAWRCEHADDWGVATVNVDSCEQINFSHLTIQNMYGFEHTSPVTIPCVADSSHYKLIKQDGHQMAFRSFYATKLKFTDCHFKAFGGDTMSPWNTVNGMFYFKDCVVEGGVDFYCPRGWAYAENCKFYAHTGPASIWHDGTNHEDAKSVLVRCEFKGYDRFKLGRFHRDAQFYLIDCEFSTNMSNETIYQVPTNNTLSWPGRVYYYNCKKQGANENLFPNNLQASKENINQQNINVQWVFQDRWNPLTQ